MKAIKPADIEKHYNLLIKGIETADLRDMLAILYSEPELAINNTDFDQLTKEEKGQFQAECSKMTCSD